MFTGLRSRLMISFALLLLVCLAVLTATFVLFFFVQVSLPELAYARLLDAAMPILEYVRDWQPGEGERLPDLTAGLLEPAREQKVRALLVVMPGGTIVGDTEQEWADRRVSIDFRLAEPKLPNQILRGRARGPDRRWLFYIATPLNPNLRPGSARTVYLVLTLPRWEAARPFTGSLWRSVLLSGTVAFLLSILLAFWLARSLSTPLQRAAAAAERVAAGDYSASLDITVPDEARRLAQSFNTMTRAVESSQRSQRDFVANVSHEIKTPLTSIQGFAQALLDGTANDERSIHRSVSVIHDEAERLSRLVHKLLDLARLESGEVSMSWSPVDLVPLLRHCTEGFALLAEEKGVRLILDAPATAAIVGDGDRLMQVFTNLVDNALKYTDAGGRITLGLANHPEQQTTSITVADTGCGIPAQDLPRVFERFYQVDKSRSRNPDARRAGVGLGLAIAAQIVRAHNGQLAVESVVGVGTRFTVTLPHNPVESSQL